MLTVLFWNVNGLDLSNEITRLVSSHSVDILVLAEATHPGLAPDSLVAKLNVDSAGRKFDFSAGRTCRRVTVFTSEVWGPLTPLLETQHYTIRVMTTLKIGEIILVGAHMPSKLQSSNQSQDNELLLFADDIRQIEAERNHRQTIVVGDLNVNPFESGMISAKHLHAVSSKSIAVQGTRTVLDREYPFFYNPMWRFFGDHPDRPPGTYFYRKNIHDCYFWNVFDQVLIRPTLLTYWNDHDLQVLSKVDKVSLLSKSGVPGGKKRSDHLPLLFRLDQ